MGSLWNGRSQITLEFVFCSFPQGRIMNALDIEEELKKYLLVVKEKIANKEVEQTIGSEEYGLI